MFARSLRVPRSRKELEESKTKNPKQRIMTFQSRMQLHVLIYKIVSLRIPCGNHEDSTSVREKLESETRKRIRRLHEIEGKSEIEIARTLCDMYQERLDQLPQSARMGLTKAPIRNRRQICKS